MHFGGIMINWNIDLHCAVCIFLFHSFQEGGWVINWLKLKLFQDIFPSYVKGWAYWKAYARSSRGRSRERKKEKQIFFINREELEFDGPMMSHTRGSRKTTEVQPPTSLNPTAAESTRLLWANGVSRENRKRPCDLKISYLVEIAKFHQELLYLPSLGTQVNSASLHLHGAGWLSLAE